MGLFGFPLLLIPFAIYNIVAFLMPGVGFAAPMVQVPLYSGASWPVSLGDLLIAFTMLMLLFEVVKITRVWRRGLVDHGLAVLVFAGFTAEFVLVRQAATPTFFLLVAASFVEAFAGFSLGLMFRRMRRQLAEDVRVPAHPLEPARPASAPSPSAAVAPVAAVPPADPPPAAQPIHSTASNAPVVEPAAPMTGPHMPSSDQTPSPKETS